MNEFGCVHWNRCNFYVNMEDGLKHIDCELITKRLINYLSTYYHYLYTVANRTCGFIYVHNELMKMRHW